MSIIKDIKIVLAVPDFKLQEILVYLLKAWDYSVAILEEGGNVLEYIKKENPSLVIIDAAFENKHGLAICQEMKGDFLTSYIPTIVLIDKKQLRRDLLRIEEGVDDYLIKPPDPIDLEIRITLALRSASHHGNASALTRLPGGRLIEKELKKRLESGEPFSFHYVDIDNFKPFNDKYGYIKGNEIIKETARILSKNVKAFGNKDDFVGHGGGDDFVVITSPQKAEAIAETSLKDFDSSVPIYYSESDKKAGFIVAADRSGKITNIPLMSLSIAIVNKAFGRILNLLELMDTTAELKKYLKGLPGSNFMVNRRSLDKGIRHRRDKKTEDKAWSGR